MHKFVIPEFESRIFDQLNKGDEKTPRMWSVHNQSLQQDPSDLLLDGLSVGLSKEVQHGAAKVVRVAVGVPQLVGNGIQEKVAPCTGENMSSITT